jgi:hypothetical protein
MPKKTKKSRTVSLGKKCVGELCFNPQKGKLEFSIDKKTCSDDIRKHLEAGTKMVITEKEGD